MSDSSISSVQISLLGGVRIDNSDGRTIDPLPRKCQELLAALALDPGTSITVSRLVTLIWGDDPPRTAEKTLQTYVARLRRELGHESIARTGAAYRLDVEPSSIDTSRFREALGLGNVDAALREWKGVPLAGIEATSLQPLLDSLTEEWLDAMEGHLEEAVDRDPGATTGRLTELVAAHPFREGLWALLMTALYRTGRQAEALEAYRRARSTLIDELGVEPGSRLRDLEGLILRQDDELGGQTASGRRRRSLSAPSGTVTFGFAELDQVAVLWSRHPAQAGDVLGAFVAMVSTLAEESGGLVFISGSETVGAAFDSAVKACSWAQAVHRATASTTWSHGEPLGVRIALHTGEAEERNGSYFGPTVTLARRLASAGAPGQSIATSATAMLSGSQQQELGSFAIEGEATAHPLHQIGSGSFPPIAVGATMDRVPRPPHSLLGREQIVDDVTAALAAGSALTLVGPGGIGKTRLAVEVVRRRDPSLARTWFIGLAEIAESDDVLRAVSDSVGARESSGRSLVDSVVVVLGSRPSLLVLDNCEHVIDGVSDLVSHLIDRCPTVAVLATSREGLGIPAERLIPVGPLDPENAGVQLFIERAHAVDPGIQLDRGAVELVCRRLDGVPLAIELAAASARTLAPEDLVERLDSMFSLLTGSRRGKLERHRTLRATIQWSFDLLSADEQLLFRRLAVFSGPFDLGAAEHVVVDDQLSHQDVGALISDLVDRSMCLVESGTNGRRFRLLEPMRQFALEELHLTESDADLRRRHAEHVRGQVATIHGLLAGSHEIEGAAKLAELWPNLRGALDWALDAGDIRLAADLVEPAAAQGFLRRGLGELSDWIERILRLADPTDHDIISMGLLWIALYAQLNEDRSTYDRVVGHTGCPNAPLALLAASIIDGDTKGVLVQVPEALAEADRRGDKILGPVVEIIHAGNLLQAGRLDELDAHLNSVINGSENSLPPTLLSWMLFMAVTLRDIRGGEPADSDLYDRIATMPLPPRTNSPTPTLAARRAARLGDHVSAFEILRDHIDDLLAGDNLNGALIVAVELSNMLATAERLTEAAEILGQLDALGVDDISGFDALLAETRRLVSANPTATETRSAAARQSGDPKAMLHSMTSMLEAPPTVS